MNPQPAPEEKSAWVCGKCGSPLETTKVNVRYLDFSYSVELQVCPQCKRPLVPVELALGKMLEAEKTLEDK